MVTVEAARLVDHTDQPLAAEGSSRTGRSLAAVAVAELPGHTDR